MSKYVELAKRENNNKRGFLIVNPYLGKHVAMNPANIFKMFDEVADLVPNNIVPEKTLVIGFAETATALGIHYAVKNHTYFVQTTREKVPFFSDGQLYFSEEHSHATEQYIAKNGINRIINEIDRIIFIDDEITTGNTVLNAIRAIEKEYNKKFQYDVVSVLNSMNDEHRHIYSENNIGVHFLEYINNSDYEEIAKSLKSDGEYHDCSKSDKEYDVAIYETSAVSYDTRMLIYGKEYINDRTAITKELVQQFPTDSKNILVLGTEEFMYQGLLFAKALQDKYNANVKFHATTRSPISVSKDTSYPLHNQYKLKSLYDNNRTTYIYDIEQYDEVFIVTESGYLNKSGLNTLVNALNQKNINVITI